MIGVNMISKILETLAEYMIKRRKSLKISQKKLADLTGLHESVIRRYEHTKYQSCSLERLILILSVLENVEKT
jgi:predicted transcriptional regulator